MLCQFSLVVKKGKQSKRTYPTFCLKLKSCESCVYEIRLEMLFEEEKVLAEPTQLSISPKEMDKSIGPQPFLRNLKY